MLKLQDIVDVIQLQELQNSFANATGLAAVLVDFRGRPITEYSNFTGFCRLIRKEPQFHDTCYKCDAFGGLEAARKETYYVYRCHAGLVDFAIPVVVQGQLMGSLLVGQGKVAEAEQDKLDYITTASRFWKEKEELVNEYSKIPVTSYEKITAAAETMFYVLNELIDKAVTEYEASVPVGDKDNPRGSLPTEEEGEPYHLDAPLDDVRVRREKQEIQLALRYIEDHYQKGVTLEEVAAHVHLSTYYLSKLFKKELKTNFVQYVTERKMKKAKELLEWTDMPVLQIALELHYKEPNYFSKVFKKIVGQTPSEYRKEKEQNRDDSSLFQKHTRVLNGKWYI
ncbi:PocR ligand-binding domain-containing protein [Bacillus piscicola]|uniref:PocR ligand-binding domain-containing protein n=1 Tax=Bacillus piscicola TaxID=1632684 RepID=UPI001F090178|nr:PocR ligand-binding domain-containing protein [Bacillus piscicola]